MKTYSLLLSSCILLALSGCGQDKTEAAAPMVRPVKLAEVKDAAGERIRSFPAVVEATQDAALTFRVNGLLQELLVRPGYEVKEGQLLAKLDPKDFQLVHDQAKANFDLAKSEFSRMESLLAQKLVSPSQYDKAKAQLQIAEANFNTAETNLAYTELHAPFSGTVAKLYVERFENVVAKQTIMEVQGRSTIDLVIHVPEDIIAKVKRGTNYEPEVEFDAHPGQRYRVKIKEWDIRANESTHAYKVVFSMATPAQFNVLSGMTGMVYIDLSQVTTMEFGQLQIPNEALFSVPEQAQKNFVWVFDSASSQIHRREVSIGQVTSHGVVINSGLQPGEQVVAAGVGLLNEGQTVRPWQRERGL